MKHNGGRAPGEHSQSERITHVMFNNCYPHGDNFKKGTDVKPLPNYHKRIKQMMRNKSKTCFVEWFRTLKRNRFLYEKSSESENGGHSCLYMQA